MLARRTLDANRGRRFLALAAVYDGGSRGDAARIGSVGLQTVRDWVLRFNAAGPDGLVDGKALGQTPKLNDAQRQALARIVESGPIPAVHGVVRWRPIDLAQVEPAAEAFRKKFPALVEDIAHREAAGARIEIRFQDEARVGQKNEITRRWARRGTRPRAPRDQRTRSAYIFGAICPKEGKGAGLVLPFCNSAAMTLHLEEISGAVAPDAHAVLVMDQAGWHTSAKLNVPANITVVTLPPRSPELNPVENIWQFMRDNWLSNRVFSGHDDIVNHCCDAWNKLIAQPSKIISIGHREWAHR